MARYRRLDMARGRDSIATLSSVGVLMKHLKINLGIVKIEILRDPEKELELEERRLLLEVAKAKNWEASRRSKMSVIEAKFHEKIKGIKHDSN